jgi:valyl-tRNA synthetase
MTIADSFNAAEAEARITKAWESTGAFAAGANKRRDDAFSIMIPPPNVTGSLHMGHAFNNTLQDILIRWHRMRGFDTLWQPGTDHAGIATQMVTEREMAANGEPPRRDMGRDAFTLRVWEQKKKSRGTIIGQLKRLGASCDWSREAFTMSGAPNAPEDEDGNFHDAVIRVFVEMYNKGFIYRGKRLVNWDPKFETAISDLEVENIETPGHMWHFKYPLAGGATYEYVEKDEDGTVTLRETRDYISIATTRPETMLGDGAVAVHPSDDRYAPIVGQLCEIPVGPKEHRRLIPIITDDYPDPEFGSGAVKITGAHDFNDYGVAKRGGIPCYRLMDTRGALRADGAPYAEAAALALAVAKGEKTLTEAEVDAVNLVPDHLRSMDRFEARKAVVAEITAEGLAVMTRADDARLGTKLGEEDDPSAHVPLIEAKAIMQPFGDRSKVVIEPMLTDQWFVDAAKIVGPALDAVKDGTVKIVPESGEKTYYHWLENIEPWCISRQLWWGHQIPVWFDQNGEQYCAETEAAAQAMAGSDAVLTRDPDVLDTWFSSGLWPIGTLGWPEQTDELRRFFPTSVLVTGQDILFFWVARMMMMQLAVVDQIPFHDVYLHGLVRDDKGRKMSKSLGNVVDPLDIIDEYGADALRFTNAAMASLGGVLKLDKKRIEGYRNFATKLWNTARFASMNGAFENHTGARPETTQTVNKWIIGEIAKTRETVDEALKNYRFNDAALALYAFTWGTFCDRFIEFSKPSIYGEDAGAKTETLATLAWSLDQILLMLHPIMPFVTEELWGSLCDRPKMLVHGDWPEDPAADAVDPKAEKEIALVIALIDGIRSARAQMGVRASAEIPLLVRDIDTDAQSAWDANSAMIRRETKVQTAEHVADFPKGTVTIPIPGATFGLPLDGIIDVAKEKARLDKSLTKLAKEIGGMAGRLKNPKFLASAPDEVIAETKANLAIREEEASKLQEAVARLAELG